MDTEPGVCAIGCWHNLTVIVWWSQATGPAVERVAQITRRLCEEHSEGFSNIHVIRDKAELPTAEAREGFVSMMKRHARQLNNVAVVVGGAGFWASAMRSVITSMRFVSPRSFELRLHGASHEITSWLPAAHMERTNVLLDRRELARVLAEADACAERGEVELTTPRPSVPMFSQRAPIRPRTNRPER